MTEPPPLPPHVEQTVRAVEQLHVEHHESATPLDRFLEWLRNRASRPGFTLGLIVLVALWIGLNTALRRTAWAWDPPPFAYLEFALTAFAAVAAVLILSTQSRADRLASHREQLILQMGLVGEQRSAKLVALLEELRRDSPQVRDRVDPEAQQMTESVDPRALSQALRDSDKVDPPGLP